MYLKYIYIVILPIFLFTCLSCNKDEHEDIPVQLSIERIFEPVITDMTSSSPICLPDGINSNITLINSQQELIRNIPSEIIEETIDSMDIPGKITTTLKDWVGGATRSIVTYFMEQNIQIF